MAADISSLSGGNETYIDSDWTMDATGNLSLLGGGTAVYVNGTGPKTAVLIGSPVLVSATSGSAQFVVSSLDDGSGGQIGMSAGGTGAIQLTAGVAFVGSSATVGPESITLTVGPPDVGSSIQMSATGITLSFGPPGVGAEVTINAEGVSISMAGVVKFSLTALGIKEEFAAVIRNLAAEGHTLTSAENIAQIGVAGIELTGMTLTQTAEAASDQSAAIASAAAEATSTESAAIKMIN